MRSADGLSRTSYATKRRRSKPEVCLDRLPGDAAPFFESFPRVSEIGPILQEADVLLFFERGARQPLFSPSVPGAERSRRTIPGLRLAELGSSTGPPSACFPKRNHTTLNRLPNIPNCSLQVEGGLQDEPSLRSRPEKACESKRSVCSHSASPTEDLRDSGHRHIDHLRQRTGRETKRSHELCFENFTGVDRHLALHLRDCSV